MEDVMGHDLHGVQCLTALRVNVNGIILTFVTLVTIARQTCVNSGMWILRSINALVVNVNFQVTTQNIHGGHLSADALMCEQLDCVEQKVQCVTEDFWLQVRLKIAIG